MRLVILPKGPKIYAQEGDPFLLTCYGANQEPTFFTNLKWTNPRGEVIDDRILDHSQDYVVKKRHKDNALLLSFLNPRESLSGNYSCNGLFQNVDRLSDSIEVTFYQGITWEDCPQTQVLVKRKSDAIIRCKVSAKPPADVTWTRDGEELDSKR